MKIELANCPINKTNLKKKNKNAGLFNQKHSSQRCKQNNLYKQFFKVQHSVHQTNQEDTMSRRNTGERKHNLCSQTQHRAAVGRNIGQKVRLKSLTLLLLTIIIFLC